MEPGQLVMDVYLNTGKQLNINGETMQKRQCKQIVEKKCRKEPSKFKYTKNIHKGKPCNLLLCPYRGELRCDDSVLGKHTTLPEGAHLCWWAITGHNGLNCTDLGSCNDLEGANEFLKEFQPIGLWGYFSDPGHWFITGIVSSPLKKVRYTQAQLWWQRQYDVHNYLRDVK